VSAPHAARDEAAFGAPRTYDLWGKAVNVRDALPRSLGGIDPSSSTGAREAFLTLSELYAALTESPHVSTCDHHVQKEASYDAVLRQFAASGLLIEEFRCDADSFERYLEKSLTVYEASNDYLRNQGGLAGYFPQKAFEHWISAEYLQWSPRDRVLDFAAWISPATEVLSRHRPADFYKHDITFETDLDARRVSGFSDAVESPSDYFDAVMAHCAIDNFEQDYDTRFFLEARRILRPGGRLLVTPLHMSEQFENLVAIGGRGITLDAGAKLVMGAPGGLRFARLYDVAALRGRVLEPAVGLEFRIVHVTGLPLRKYPTTCTNRFMLVAVKR